MSTFNEKDDHNTTGNISDSEEQLSHDNDRFRTETDTQDFQEEALDLEEEEESGKKSKSKTVKIIAGVGVAAVVIAGGVIALSGGSHESNDNVQPTKQKETSESKKEEVKPEVVKTSEGVNSSTSDPDLQSALNVKKQPEVKHELPFKDVQTETPPAPVGQPVAPVEQGSLTPPAPVGQGEVGQPVAPVEQGSLTPPAPVGQGEVGQPVAPVEQGSLTPPAPVGQGEVGQPVAPVEQGSLTPPAPVGQGEIGQPVAPVVHEEVKQPSVPVEHGTLTPPAPVGQGEIGHTVAPIVHEEVKQPEVSHLTDQDTGLIGDNQSGMIDPSDTSDSSTQNSDINGSMDKILSQMNSLSENVKSLSDKVNKIDETIIVKKADFDKLVDRVTALENLHKDKNGKIVACPCETGKGNEKAKEISSNKATTQKKSSVVKKQHYKPRDSITVVKKSGDLTSHRSKGYTAPKEIRRSGASMKLESIVGDRAWVRTSNGSIRSYSVGDVLPNGKVIGNVDSQNGVFDKSGVKVLSR